MPMMEPAVGASRAKLQNLKANYNGFNGILLMVSMDGNHVDIVDKNRHVGFLLFEEIGIFV